MSSLLRDATRLLRDSGLPFEITQGSKHNEVWIRGRMVLCISKSDRGRNTKKLQSIINRAHEATP